MPERPADCSAEIADALQRLFHLRARRRSQPLPLDISGLKARMDQAHPGGAAMRAADYALLRDVGLILARAEGPVTMGDLSRALDVPLSSTTRIVDWLVASGYAERQPDLDDRRIVRVAFTASGLEISRAMHAFVQERVAGWLRHFTPEECTMLARLLRKLVRAWEEEA